MVNNKSSLEYVKYFNHANNNQLGFQVGALIAISKGNGANKQEEMAEIVDDIVRYHSIRDARTWNTPTERAKFQSSADTTFYRSEKLSRAYKNELKAYPELIEMLEERAIRSTLDSIKKIDGFQRTMNIMTENSVSMLNEIMPFLEQNKSKYKEDYDQANILKSKPNLKPFFNKSADKELAIKELLSMRELSEAFRNLDNTHARLSRGHNPVFEKYTSNKEYYKEAIPLIEEMIRRTDNMKFGEKEEFDKGSRMHADQMKGVMENYKKIKTEIFQKAGFDKNDINEIQNRVKFLREDSSSYFINHATITKMTGTNRDLNNSVDETLIQKPSLFKRIGDSLRASFSKTETTDEVMNPAKIDEPSKSVFQQIAERFRRKEHEEVSAESVANISETTPVNEQPVIKVPEKQIIKAETPPVEKVIINKTEEKDIYQQLVDIQKVMELHGGRVDELKNRGDLAKFEGHIQQIKGWANKLSDMDAKDIILEKSMEKAYKMCKDYNNIVQANNEERELLGKGLSAMQLATMSGKLSSHKDLKARYEQASQVAEIVGRFNDQHQCIEHESQAELDKMRRYVNNDNQLIKCFKIDKLSNKLAQNDLDDPIVRHSLSTMYKNKGTENPIHKLIAESHAALMDYKTINASLRTPELELMAEKIKQNLVKFSGIHKELQAGTFSTSLDIQLENIENYRIKNRGIEIEPNRKQALTV